MLTARKLKHLRFGQEFKTAPWKINQWTGMNTSVPPPPPSQWTHSCPDSGQEPIRGWNIPHNSDRNRAQDFPKPTFASVSLCDEDRCKLALALKWNETFVWWLIVELGNVTLSRSKHRVLAIISDIWKAVICTVRRPGFQFQRKRLIEKKLAKTVQWDTYWKKQFDECYSSFRTAYTQTFPFVFFSIS